MTESETASIDRAEVERFSAAAHGWWDPDGPFAPLHRLNPARLSIVRELALAHFGRDGATRRPFSGLRLIDLGCGGGLVTEPMARLGFDVIGADPSDAALETARAHAEASGLAIRYRALTEEAPSAEGDAPFDVVLALEVIEHAPDPARFVAEAARLLVPGGLMVLSTLNRTLRALALAKIAAEYILRWVPAGTHDWRKFATPEELAMRLRAAGLEPAPPIGLAFNPLSGQWRRSSDCRINYLIAAAKPSVAPAAALR